MVESKHCSIGINKNNVCRRLTSSFDFLFYNCGLSIHGRLAKQNIIISSLLKNIISLLLLGEELR
jgi:hypothetical protein